MKSAKEELQGFRVNVDLPLNTELENNHLLYEHKCLGIALEILDEMLSLTPVDPVSRPYEHEAYRTEGRNDCLEEIREIAEKGITKWRAREVELRALIEEGRASEIRKPGA